MWFVGGRSGGVIVIFQTEQSSIVDRSVCCRWASATSSRAYKEVDAHYSKLHGQARRSNVDRRKYCQLCSTEDGCVFHTERPRRLTVSCDERRAVEKFLCFAFRTKFHRGILIFFDIPEFSHITVYDRCTEAPMPKPSSICPFVSIE